jgi:hypothetical protein
MSLERWNQHCNRTNESHEQTALVGAYRKFNRLLCCDERSSCFVRSENVLIHMDARKMYLSVLVTKAHYTFFQPLRN